MKNKKLFGVLSLLLVTGFILGGCNKKPKTSSDDTPTSSESQKQKFTVNFVVEGQVVQTSQVEEGSVAVYEGATPTKATTAGAFKTLFRGWDKDVAQPIKEDTTFTAVFGDYVENLPMETFEYYSSDGDLHDQGQWIPISWDNESNKWKDDLGPSSVKLGTRATEGSKSLRFNAWENGVTYKFGKNLEAVPDDYTQPLGVNALQFSLMTKAINEVKVILYTADIEVDGKTLTPAFYYKLNVTSNEYVNYTLPLGGDWALWDNKAEYGTMASTRYYTGMHQDDLLRHLRKFEVSFKGNAGGSACVSFFDNVKFVTLDNPSFVDQDVIDGQNVCYTYTGKTANNLTMRLDITGNTTATATILDSPTPTAPINGTIESDSNYTVTFTSEDNGATLVYKGRMTDNGKRMTFISATGTLAEYANGMDLNGVQVVENFEQYTADGTAYYQGQTNKDARTGARGNYYSEYKGGGTSEYTGSGWCLMGGSGDQFHLMNEAGQGHGGSNKYGSFKNSKTLQMKYMQWGLFDGSAEKKAFHGSKMGFWVKSLSSATIQVKAYSVPNPTYAEEKENVSVKKQPLTIEVGAIGSWKHYEIELNPGLTYYGYALFLDANYIRDTQVFIDDVEIYTDSPYATYVAPAPQPADVVPAGAYATKIMNGTVDAFLNVVDGSNAILSAPAASMTLSATYTYANRVATFTLQDTTVYKARLSNDNKTLEYVEVTGGTEQVRTALTNASFTMPNYAEHAEQYTESGTMYRSGNVDSNNISGARGAYHCDMYNPSGTDKSAAGDSNWSLTPAQFDALSLIENDGADGSKSIEFAFGSTNVRYIQWEAFRGNIAKKSGVTKFGIYLKNPSDIDLQVKILVYKVSKIVQANIGDDTKRVTKTVTMPAGSGWTLYTVDLDSATDYYAFGLNTITKTGDASTVKFARFDCAYFF